MSSHQTTDARLFSTALVRKRPIIRAHKEWQRTTTSLSERRVVSPVHPRDVSRSGSRLTFLGRAFSATCNVAIGAWTHDDQCNSGLRPCQWRHPSVEVTVTQLTWVTDVRPMVSQSGQCDRSREADVCTVLKKLAELHLSIVALSGTNRTVVSSTCAIITFPGLRLSRVNHPSLTPWVRWCLCLCHKEYIHRCCSP